jgi:HK97 family phage major capsid protein
MVRAATVTIRAGVGTVPMATQTLRIASVTQDLVPGFRAEGTAFPQNDIALGAIDMRARTIGVITSASMELLADSPIASDMLVAALTGSMAVAVDKAMLSGDGNSVSPADNPRGILNWANINTIAVGAAPANFDQWLNGLHQIELNNLFGSAVIDHPNTVNELRLLKNTLNDPMRQPEAYAGLAKYMTTSMTAGVSLEGDYTQAVFGMREGVTIEATRVGTDPGGNSALSKGLVHVRAYMRLDTAVLRPKAFCSLTGIA